MAAILLLFLWNEHNWDKSELPVTLFFLWMERNRDRFKLPVIDVLWMDRAANLGIAFADSHSHISKLVHTKLLTDPYLTALEMLDILKDRTLICKALAIGQHKNDTLTSIFSSE
ncbi:hypothetical protein LguiA_033800 [Lonicera macranthoides]